MFLNFYLFYWYVFIVIMDMFLLFESDSLEYLYLVFCGYFCEVTEGVREIFYESFI